MLNKDTELKNSDAYLELLDAYKGLQEDYIRLSEAFYKERSEGGNSCFPMFTSFSKTRLVLENAGLRVENRFLKRRRYYPAGIEKLESDEKLKYYAQRLDENAPLPFEMEIVKILAYRRMLEILGVPCDEILERIGEFDD